MRFTGLFIAIGGVAFWLAIPRYMEEVTVLLNEIHSNLVDFILIGLMILGGIVFAYDYRTRKDENVNDKDICQKIHEELKDGIDSLDGTLTRETQEHEIEGKKIHYKHIYMNRKVFEGYFNSGNFNHINHKLQQSLQDIYHKIKIHDELVQKVVDKQYVNDDIIELNKIEKEMLKEIPSMMESLKKYF